MVNTMNSQTTTAADEADQVPLQEHKPKDRGLALTVLTVIWLCLVGIGMSSLWKYQITPGAVTASPQHWPADSLIKPNPNRPTLIMFAHPRCPCTRSSISELALVMEHCFGHVDARVLFFKSSEFSAGWEKTDLWSSAAAIPDVKVACDAEGAEAARFHATTSGYVLLYDVNGKLRFHGGITGSRGHSGDNAGRSAIEAILMGGLAETKQTFVFGCPLLGQNDACRKENQECRQQ